MAQILLESFDRDENRNRKAHTAVKSLYSSFVYNGKKYFQIDMYGSAKREKPEQVSQSIQLDSDTAQILVKLLIDEFDLDI